MVPMYGQSQTLQIEHVLQPARIGNMHGNAHSIIMTNYIICIHKFGSSIELFVKSSATNAIIGYSGLILCEIIMSGPVACLQMGQRSAFTHAN